MANAELLDRLRGEVGDLVAQHAETRGVADFARYKGRPVAFMREELNFEPYAKQIAIAESFLANKRTVVRGAHGTGKDALLGALALYAAYVEGMLVLVISATERQLLGQLWREIAARFSPRLPGSLYTSDLRIGGEKRIIAMTSGSTSNLTGWHDPHGVCILISESQSEQVGEAAFDAAIASAVDDASRIVVVGNPVKAAGRFFEVSRKDSWHAIAISAFDHPNVIEGRVVIPGGPSPTWPAEMAAEFGVESPWYISRCLGEFPTEGSIDSLVKLQWLEDAYARHEAGAGFVASPPPVVALDVARSLDRDESVAAVVQGARVLSLTAWRVRDLVATASRFLLVADRARAEWYGSFTHRGFDPESEVWSDPDKLNVWANSMGISPIGLYCDSPGVGGGVVDDCKRRGRAVVEYWGWSPARDPQRFANVRAEAHWTFRTLLQDGKAALPRDPALHEQALAIEWSQDAKGRIAILPKEELRKTLGRSPDNLDSCVIGLYAANGGVRPPSVSISQWEGL